MVDLRMEDRTLTATTERGPGCNPGWVLSGSEQSRSALTLILRECVGIPLQAFGDRLGKQYWRRSIVFPGELLERPSCRFGQQARQAESKHGSSPRDEQHPPQPDVLLELGHKKDPQKGAQFADASRYAMAGRPHAGRKY